LILFEDSCIVNNWIVMSCRRSRRWRE